MASHVNESARLGRPEFKFSARARLAFPAQE